MKHRELLSHRVVAISISESPDMPALGLSDEHLRDAMAEIARHLLAAGARLAYGGDLRTHGFTDLLFELVARHGRDLDPGDERSSVTDYLAWPFHINMPAADIERYASELEGSVRLAFLTLDGGRLTMAERLLASQVQPTETEWEHGLTAMRRVMQAETNARVVLGGRVEGYKGVMPGIAEEAILTLQARQPLFLAGGFGGCARDVAEALGLVSPSASSRPGWAGRETIEKFTGAELGNGLTPEENNTLLHTPHVDQAVTLILRGLVHLVGADPSSPV